MEACRRNGAIGVICKGVYTIILIERYICVIGVNLLKIDAPCKYALWNKIERIANTILPAHGFCCFYTYPFEKDVLHLVLT